jgi:UDP-glucose 4-epimerase
MIAHEAGRTTLPLPETLLSLLLGRAGLPRLSRGALAHIKYPIVVDAASFRAGTGFAHRFDELATVRTFADAFPAAGQARAGALP